MYMWTAGHYYYEKPYAVVGTVNENSNFLIKSQEPTILTTIDYDDNNKERQIVITNYIDECYLN